ncbi:MAG: hypothetical protein U5L09_16260 [Bacteroidales bacterium]|nr:hypothetical protein [Bacteroidales bacterium]
MVHKEKIKILLLSVLMLPSALHVKDLKQKLNGTGVKIVVGGAPFRFDENLWKEVALMRLVKTLPRPFKLFQK